MHEVQEAGDRGRPDVVSVLARGLSILHAFVPRNEWLGNHEIADRTGLPRPTVSRLTDALTRLGYLTYSSTRGRYRLGVAALGLGYHAVSKLDVRTLAHEPMQALADEAGVLMMLATREDTVMVALEVCHSRTSLFTLRVDVGSRLVLPFSALGRVCYATMAEAERAELRARLAAKTARGQAGAAEIDAMLDDAVREYTRHKYCTAFGSLEGGVNGIAVALEVTGTPVHYFLGAAAAASTFRPQRVTGELMPKLVAVARALERKLVSQHAARSRP